MINLDVMVKNHAIKRKVDMWVAFVIHRTNSPVYGPGTGTGIPTLL